MATNSDRIFELIRNTIYLGAIVLVVLATVFQQLRIDAIAIKLATLEGKIESIDEYGGRALFEHRNLPIQKGHPIKEVCEICPKDNK